ncbi:c-type cytochrome [Ideonella sp. YS5]|uniref:c-type cytochrome n=1 Tax=Ideonella sp. YS5 TaxID=3453714 RepID=UPI003EEDC6E0
MKTPAAFAITVALAATLALPAYANEPAVAPKADLAKGQALSTSVCAACHTSDGSRGSPANPILQGQHPEYLAKQLADFKAGKRANPIMQGMAAPLSDADMTNVAAFYAGKQAKPGFAKHKDTVALGEKIYRGGIPDKHVPACAGCHSPTGAGIPAQYPRLGGQHADYIAAQLQAFRDHKRLNNAPMQQISAQMNNEEIAAVSDYISGLK